MAMKFVLDGTNNKDDRGTIVAVFSLPRHYEIIVSNSGWFEVFEEGVLERECATFRDAFDAIVGGSE